jgi:hypothetical protein
MVIELLILKFSFLIKINPREKEIIKIKVKNSVLLFKGKVKP